MNFLAREFDRRIKSKYKFCNALIVHTIYQTLTRYVLTAFQNESIRKWYAFQVSTCIFGAYTMDYLEENLVWST